MASILLPILDKLAQSYNIDYHYLTMPMAIAVNLSYALPAAAATNAIVFSCGYLKLKDMVNSA